MRRMPGRNANRLSGLWVATESRLISTHRERPEATDLDPLSRREGLTHLLEECRNGRFHIRCPEVRLLVRDQRGEFGQKYGHTAD